MAKSRPTVVFIGGPNGSGKTTLSKDLRARSWFSDFEFINADLIARERFGDWDSPQARQQSALFAATLISASIRAGHNIAVETVFGRSGVLLMRRAKAAGYLVRFYFIGTSDPAINIARVAARVSRGGHDIPALAIVERYHHAMAALEAGLVAADHGHVFDNSIEDVPLRRLYRTRNGTVAQQFTASLPAWADIIERLPAT